MIKVKFGMEEYIMGLLLHAKFGFVWQRGLGTEAPKGQNLVISCHAEQ